MILLKIPERDLGYAQRPPFLPPPLPPLFGAWVKAEPAAVFESLPVEPLFSTREAAEAAFGEVCSFLAIVIHPLSYLEEKLFPNSTGGPSAQLPSWGARAEEPGTTSRVILQVLCRLRMKPEEREF